MVLRGWENSKKWLPLVLQTQPNFGEMEGRVKDWPTWCCSISYACYWEREQKVELVSGVENNSGVGEWKRAFGKWRWWHCCTGYC